MEQTLLDRMFAAIVLLSVLTTLLVILAVAIIGLTDTIYTVLVGLLLATVIVRGTRNT